MEMILSFGYFARLLVTNKIENTFTQQDLISNIVKKIDPLSVIFYNPDNYKDKIVNKSLICNIINGKRTLNARINNNPPSVEEVIKDFQYLTDCFDDSGKVRIILCLYDVIREDNLIDSFTRESFFRFFGKNKSDFLDSENFNFVDICAKTSLYTICTFFDKCNKKKAADYLKSFKNEDEFIEHQNDILRIYYPKWDTNTSTLALPKLYNDYLIPADGNVPFMRINPDLINADDESYKKVSAEEKKEEIELTRKLFNQTYDLLSSMKNSFEKKYGKE